MNSDKINISVDRELLARFVRGECTSAEQEEVKLFLNQTEWKQALDDLLMDDFEHFEYRSYTEVENAVWNQQFKDNYASRTVSSHSGWNIAWIGYVAACFLVASFCYWYFNSYQKPETTSLKQMVMLEQINPKGQRSVVTLPDSTIVYLGAASSIRYPQQFGSGNREISLKGEAYFEVAHDKKHPFTIQTGRIQTKVLGTTFKINAFKDVIVSVASGKVQVTKNAGVPIAILTRGQQVKWETKTGKAVLTTLDAEEITEWKDGKVTFANASLIEVAEILERWHNVDIRFKDERTAQVKLSLILKATVPIQHSLDIICSTLHLKYILNGRTIMIKN